MAFIDGGHYRTSTTHMANVGDTLANISGGRIKGPITLHQFATSAVEVTLDISKARRELGYAPVITAAEGLAELRAMHAQREGAGPQH